MHFNNLPTFANVPLGRFRQWLARSNSLGMYLEKLAQRFNERIVLFKSLQLFLFCLGMILVYHQPADAQQEIHVGRFSSETPAQKIPVGWEPLHFRNIKKYTQYTLVKDSGQTVVKAVCRGSSSGLIRHVRIDPEKYPIIQWRWKISNVFKKGDVTKKSCDDYPARLYITFEFDPGKATMMERAKYKVLKFIFGKTPPVDAINYIWASNAPYGTAVPSPYTRQSMMIVVQSGKMELNRWVIEKRDIYADYMAVFGEKPPMISGIAIMSDGNDTGGSVTAHYGDIVIRSRD